MANRKVLFSNVSDGSQDTVAGVGDIAPLTFSVQTVTPATTDTVTVSSGRHVVLVVNPAGTIAVLTVTMAGAPADGDQVTITSTQIVTSLTMNGGTILGGLASFAVASFAKYHFHGAIGKWLRIG